MFNLARVHRANRNPTSEIRHPFRARIQNKGAERRMEQIGRYQILGELGRGAMGVVFRALDPSIGREVAIKTIRLSEFTNADQRAKQRERLFREARSAGILSHPGIVTIYDMAEQDETAYIAMEFVPGPTVEEILSLNE